MATVTETASGSGTPIVTPTPIQNHVHVPINHGEKSKKFNSTEFKRWQQKMLFYLTTLNFALFLLEEAPALKEGESDREVVATVDAWKHSDFLCRNYILNGLDNILYNVYSPLKSAKELLDSLKKKIQDRECLHNKICCR